MAEQREQMTSGRNGPRAGTREMGGQMQRETRGAQGQTMEPTWGSRARRIEEPTFGPFGWLGRMMPDLDRFFEDFGFGSLLSPLRGAVQTTRGMAQVWSPDIEVSQRGDELIVKADLPGLSQEDVLIELENDMLSLHGERRSERHQERGNVTYTERSYGSFTRTIPVPEGVQPDDIEAKFDHGVLQVVVKIPEQKSRAHTIQIKPEEVGQERAPGQMRMQEREEVSRTQETTKQQPAEAQASPQAGGRSQEGRAQQEGRGAPKAQH